MLKDLISSLSNKSRIYFCTQIFSRFDTPEVDLTNVESYCMECILALAEPSVQEFAHMMGISAPNAAYKVNALIRKGYIEKTQSTLDKREFYLKPTKKFLDIYYTRNDYADKLAKRIEDRFSAEDIDKFEDMLKIIINELTPELDQKNYNISKNKKLK